MAIQILTGIFFLTLFWQTRINPFGLYEVYDYLIPFVYLSDLLLVAILTHQFWTTPRWLINFCTARRHWALAILAFLILVFLTSLTAAHPVGAFYKLAKLTLFLVFSGWIADQIEARRLTVQQIFNLVGIGLIPLILIGLIEVSLGHSLNLQLIGEWHFSITNPAIAKTLVFGREFLRPYSTFPHPNVFGGVAAVFSLVHLANTLYTRGSKLKFSVFLLGLLFSFSRAAWAAFLIGAVYTHLITKFKRIQLRQGYVGQVMPRSSVGWEMSSETKSEGVYLTLQPVKNPRRLLRQKNVLVSAILVAFGLVIALQSTTPFNWDSLSVIRRLELNRVALQVWLDHPWSGVGDSQFILFVDRYWDLTNLSRFVQPVHNIFLLILAETGLIGTVLLLNILMLPILKTWKTLDIRVQLAWLVILITGLFDHYWWSLQAGQLTLFLTLGLTLARMER